MATIFQEPVKEADVRDFDPRQVDRVAIKATGKILSNWGITDVPASELVGTRKRTWQRMRAGRWPGELSQDQRMRMSALVGLYQGLHVYFGDELADNWIKLENDGPIFKGRTPLEFMLDGGIPAIIRVRDYIDALRGGL